MRHARLAVDLRARPDPRRLYDSSDGSPDAIAVEVDQILATGYLRLRDAAALAHAETASGRSPARGARAIHGAARRGQLGSGAAGRSQELAPGGGEE